MAMLSAFAQIKKPYSQMGKWAPCSNGKRWKSARKELKFSLVCTADGARGSAVHIRQNKSAVREKCLLNEFIHTGESDAQFYQLSPEMVV